MSNSSNNSGKLKVINEEKYVESLNNIIQRDFFPDLPNLKNQLEWMDAMESNDLERMKTVQLASLKRAATNSRGRTPSNNSFDTPQIYSNSNNISNSNSSNNNNSLNTPQIYNSSSINQSPNPINNHSNRSNNNNEIDSTSLDSFVNNYISEDDASYIEIQKKQNERILHKYKWLFDKAKEINQKQQQLLLENNNSTSNNSDIKLLENNNNNNNSSTNSIVEYKPNKTSIPDTWNYRVKNQLMYIPDTNYSREIIGGPAKEIKHINTRITEKLWEDIENNSKSTQRIPTEKPFSQMTLQEQIEKLKQMEFEGKSTMEIESSMLGYISTPQIIPGGIEDESPLMTWGRVDGTPLLLDNSPISTPLSTRFSAGTPSFKIPETPKREQLANKLVDKIINKTATRSPSNSLSSTSLSNLSPAAQKYIIQKNKSSQTPSSPHDQLRKSYQLTPSPIRKSSKLQNTPLPNKYSTPTKNIRQQTPVSTPIINNNNNNNSSHNNNNNNNNNNISTQSTTSSITDNLLDFT